MERAINCRGKHNLDAAFEDYNAAAKGHPWLVVRDLDDDAACAAAFPVVRSRRFEQWMCFRMAVREIEAWLLADHLAVAEYFKVSPTSIPTDPDRESDPKRTLVNIARRSRRASIRKGMAPPPERATSVGPLYEGMIIEFGRDHWISIAPWRGATVSGALA